MTTNNASGSAHVDIQAERVEAGTIHIENHTYQVPPAASPEKKYAIARRLLKAGLPTAARKLMDEVFLDFEGSGQFQFLWLLAFLSQRTLPELTAAERNRLDVVLKETGRLELSSWSAGIDMIRRLVTISTSGTGAPSAVGDKFDELHPNVQALILRHLERVLNGPLKDELWRQDVAAAEEAQKAGGRAVRVWKFFEPDPANPRVRTVRRIALSSTGQTVAVLASALFLGSTGFLGRWLAEAGDTPALVALLLGIGAAGLALVTGAHWRFHIERRLAKERESRGREPHDPVPPIGFAADVDRLYRRYTREYAPRGADRAIWLADTAGIRRSLRNELVEVYRESRIEAPEIRWLIRYQIREIRREWLAGTLHAHRRRSAPWGARIATALAVTVASAGGVWVLQAAVRQRGLTSAGAVLVAAAAGWIAGLIWFRIAVETRRVAAETAERDERLTRYWMEFQRWEQRLADRPDDSEMARWLDADRRIMMDEAMRRYRLRWGDIIAYASLEAPGRGSRKARVPNGPWRYSHYEVLLFLLTRDGVRQITVDLRFAAASFHTWRRTNYRFDAVAAVRVTDHDDGGRDFELSLVNGDDIEVVVTEAGKAGEGEDVEMQADSALDAAGLRNTLFVLEGVAADGSGWWTGPAYRRAG